jgi:hypothetical protein
MWRCNSEGRRQLKAFKFQPHQAQVASLAILFIDVHYHQGFIFGEVAGAYANVSLRTVAKPLLNLVRIRGRNIRIILDRRQLAILFKGEQMKPRLGKLGREF